jgi:hypothetical protein
MKKLTITIAAKSFDITLEDEFARFFEAEFVRLLRTKNSIEIKDLLGAFIQECHDRYELEQAAQDAIKDIGKEL